MTDGGMSGVVALADATPDMRALTSLHVGKNSIPEKEMRDIIAIAVRMDSMKILCEIPFKDKTVTELDVSGKNLGMEGALVVAEYLDGNGAILSVNLLKNNIPMEQAKALASILKDHPTLKSLCGNSGEETVLDMSGQSIGSEGAIMLAPEIADNEAMTKLDMSNNYKNTEGRGFACGSEEFIKPIASMLKTNTSITELNVSSNFLNAEAAGILADGISDSGALNKLDISRHCIGAAQEGGRELQRICLASGIELAK
jgi:Ran GTPase-activating protein (RanGAP) involved in mRNA processing and transport